MGVERTPSSSPPRQLCALMGPFCQAFLRPCLSSHELRSCTSPFWGHEGLHERDLIERADIRRYAWQRERRPPHFSANFHDVRIRFRCGSPAAAHRRHAPPRLLMVLMLMAFDHHSSKVIIKPFFVGKNGYFLPNRYLFA